MRDVLLLALQVQVIYRLLGQSRRVLFVKPHARGGTWVGATAVEPLAGRAGLHHAIRRQYIKGEYHAVWHAPHISAGILPRRRSARRRSLDICERGL